MLSLCFCNKRQRCSGKREEKLDDVIKKGGNVRTIIVENELRRQYSRGGMALFQGDLCAGLSTEMHLLCNENRLINGPVSSSSSTTSPSTTSPSTAWKKKGGGRNGE